MIFSSSKSSDVGAALRYVEGPGRDEQHDRATLIGGGGFGFEVNNETAEIAKRLMIQNGRPEMQGDKDKYVQTDALHFSLSWHPDQVSPDGAEQRETVKRFMKALGMENAMHMVYSHADKEHPHLHVVASRVNPETRMAYDDRYRALKGRRAALEKEREDEEIGRRPIHPSRLRDHQKQAEYDMKREAVRQQDQVPLPANDPRVIQYFKDYDRASRYEAVEGLYRARYREGIKAAWEDVKTEATSLWRGGTRTLSQIKHVHDTEGGWDKYGAVRQLYRAKEKEDEHSKQFDERDLQLYRGASHKKEKEQAMVNDNLKWMRPFVDVWKQNVEKAREREKAPSMNAIERFKIKMIAKQFDEREPKPTRIELDRQASLEYLKNFRRKPPVIVQEQTKERTHGSTPSLERD